jgi:hypothetical protein
MDHTIPYHWYMQYYTCTGTIGSIAIFNMHYCPQCHSNSSPPPRRRKEQRKPRRSFSYVQALLCYNSPRCISGDGGHHRPHLSTNQNRREVFFSDIKRGSWFVCVSTSVSLKSSRTLCCVLSFRPPHSFRRSTSSHPVYEARHPPALTTPAPQHSPPTLATADASLAFSWSLQP